MKGSSELVEKEPKLEEIEKECNLHGKYLATKANVLPGAKPWTSRCPECEKVAEAKEAEKIKEEKKVRFSKRVKMLKKYSKIPERFANSTFGSYRVEEHGQQKALEACVNFSHKFMDAPNQKMDSAMFLCGHRGTGKTHLACSIINEIIEIKAICGIYETARSIIVNIRECREFGSGKNESDELNKLSSVPLLVIDEVGVQSGTRDEMNILFDVINGRYNNILPTIIVSNDSFAGISEYLGSSSIDRLKGNDGAMLVFDWNSERGKA